MDFANLGSIPRSNHTLRRYFNGKIRSAKFTKMAEIVSSEEFPKYPVNSMIIEAHEPRKLNASTFIHYYNLNGVHLIRPKFFFDNRSFDGFQYLQNLETIELDAETIKGQKSPGNSLFVLPVGLFRSYFPAYRADSLLHSRSECSLFIRTFLRSFELFNTFRSFQGHSRSVVSLVEMHSCTLLEKTTEQQSSDDHSPTADGVLRLCL